MLVRAACTHKKRCFKDPSLDASILSRPRRRRSCDCQCPEAPEFRQQCFLHVSRIASFWHLVGFSVGFSWCHIELWLHQLPFLYDCRLSVKAVLNLLFELISDQCVCWICAICAFNLVTSPSLLEPFDPGCAKLPGSSSMDKTCRIRLSDRRKAKEEERTVARKILSVQSAAGRK